MKSQVVMWIMAPCNDIRYRRFGWRCYLHSGHDYMVS